uniref:Uncharacterized protein n=1 Tax=Acrobeloides nanus TaxID=290746 RepID=A0A914ELM9_9BILA
MVLKDDDIEAKGFDEWLREVESRHALQNQNIHLLENTDRLDEAKLRSLDSTLKKVTAFMKKLKQIGSAQSIISLLPEMEKLNLSKYLDEIATSVCEAKIKIAETNAVVDLCVKVSSTYVNFPELLLSEFKKHVPSKKADKISNASKLRVDLKLLAELVLNGIFKKEGLQLLGSVLSFLVNTDKTEHVNVSILLPLCKTILFDLTELVPFKIKRLAEESKRSIPKDLSSALLTSEQKQMIAKLLYDYYISLIHHLNETRLEMNKIQKSIKRQERTK